MVVEEKEFITCKELNDYEGLIHFYTKKPFDFNIEDPDGEIDKLEKMADYHFDKVYYSNQTHSSNITVIDDNTPSFIIDNDGYVTNRRGVALLTKSADCQSIMLYDPVNRVIGNVHSGWKGTLGRIIVNAITIMITEFSCNPKNIKAFISPSILKCCFEVDEDLIDNFKKVFDNIDDLITKGDIKEGKQKYYLDTVTINKREMMKLGVLEENIILSDICTMCSNDKFNSHRGDGRGGRNIALIGLRK